MASDPNVFNTLAFFLAGPSKCQVPPSRLAELVGAEDEECRPAVRCQVLDPYDEPDGVLADAECRLIIGDPSYTFWTYLVIRSVITLSYSHNYVE